MPHIDGVENIVYEGRSERKQRKDGKIQRMEYYAKVRNAAIAALGGRCSCGEVEVGKLHIEALSEESKKWSQVLFYRKVSGEQYIGKQLSEIARLICASCRFKRLVDEAKVRRKGTGLFYWIAGVKVEQSKIVKEIHPVAGVFAHPIHEDLGVDRLEEEAENDRQNKIGTAS